MNNGRAWRFLLELERRWKPQHRKLFSDSNTLCLVSRSERSLCCQGDAVARVIWSGWFSASVRHYAAPLSRTGKSSQAAGRLNKVDADAVPEAGKPSRRVNRLINSRSVRLITDQGHVVISRMEALRRAEESDMDLVEVDAKQDPPVCKLMDFNKERFKERQREKEMKKKQSERRRLDDMKEVRFSTRTEQNDLEMKAQITIRLLQRGHRVKLVCVAHGNDNLEEKGRHLLQQILSLLQSTCKVENIPRVEKQRAWVSVRPTLGAIKLAQKASGRTGETMQSTSDSDEVDDEEVHAGHTISPAEDIRFSVGS